MNSYPLWVDSPREKADDGGYNEGHENLWGCVVVLVKVDHKQRTVFRFSARGRWIDEVKDETNQAPHLSDQHSPKRTLHSHNQHSADQPASLPVKKIPKLRACPYGAHIGPIFLFWTHIAPTWDPPNSHKNAGREGSVMIEPKTSHLSARRCIGIRSKALSRCQELSEQNFYTTIHSFIQ